MNSIDPRTTKHVFSLFISKLKSLLVGKKWVFKHVKHKYLQIFSPKLKPFQPSRCIKASFYIPENRLNFPTIKGAKTKISMKLVYQYVVIFFLF